MNKYIQVFPVLLLLLCGCSAEQEVEAQASSVTEVTSQPGESTDVESEAGIVLPTGFSAKLFAEGFVTPRHIVVNDNGDVYVTIRSGQAKFRRTNEAGGVVALRDTNGDGMADMVEKFATPDIDTGLALYDNHIYFSSMTTVYAVELGDGLVPTANIEVVLEQLPESDVGHRSKAITISDNGDLYVQIGAPSNSCQQEPGVPGSAGMMPCSLLENHGGVFRFDATARNQTPEDGYHYSTGHRNVVAMDWNETANAPYVLMHGRDGLNQLWGEYYSQEDDIELPAEEFYRLDDGDDLGWPYTYWDPIREERMVMPEFGGDGVTVAEGDEYNTPLIGFPGHSAPNDIVFYRAGQFPDRYSNGAFIAFHGGVVPRRAEPGGYNVIFAPMNARGEVTGDWEIFADDFESLASTSASVGRPTGLAVGPDGSLFIVDDAGGRIWKVSYSGE
jgi:glucose/arabinose dehydrogenase